MCLIINLPDIVHRKQSPAPAVSFYPRRQDSRPGPPPQGAPADAGHPANIRDTIIFPVIKYNWQTGQLRKIEPFQTVSIYIIIPDVQAEENGSKVVFTDSTLVPED